MASNQFPNGSAEEVLSLFAQVTDSLSGKYDPKVSGAIVALNAGLKVHGFQLDQFHKDKLDKFQVVIRNSCKDGSLDLVSRLQLLEIIELRAMKWKQNDSVANYYRHKLLQVEQCDVMYNHHGTTTSRKEQLNANAQDFNPNSSNYLASATASLTSLLSLGSNNSSLPDEGQKVTLNAAGKMERGFKPPQKQQATIKDEVVIRNSDSGKVDPGAKERLVQILGPNEEKIDNAKVLIRETIQRNQSPEPDSGLLTDLAPCVDESGDKVKQFMFTVDVGGNNNELSDSCPVLKVHGNNHELVKVAKLVLDDYFANKKFEPNNNNVAVSDSSNKNNKKTKKSQISYDRRALLSYSKSPFCRQEPIGWSPQWESMVAENPGLLRNVKLSKVSETGQVQVEEMDYFKPNPDQFMHELPRFPAGFVTNYQPRADLHNNNNNMTHLDKLFVKSSGGAISSRLNVDSYVVGVKYWDDSRGEWVTDGPGTR